MKPKENNRVSRRATKHELDKLKENKVFSTPNEPTRAKRRSLMKLLRKPTQPHTKIQKLTKTESKKIEDTPGLGGNRTLGYPTRKSTGRLVTWN